MISMPMLEPDTTPQESKMMHGGKRKKLCVKCKAEIEPGQSYVRVNGKSTHTSCAWLESEAQKHANKPR